MDLELAAERLRGETLNFDLVVGGMVIGMYLPIFKLAAVV